MNGMQNITNSKEYMFALSFKSILLPISPGIVANFKNNKHCKFYVLTAL